MTVDWGSLEERWQREWDKEGVSEPKPDPDREKFFITVAYPYPNSPQHVGHARTFTMTDVYARYKRMRGFNVLFPMAFHYTGTPILAMAKRVTSDDRDLIRDFIDIYHVPREVIPSFSEPIKIAEYFHKEIKRGMREIGYSIDWRREFTTIDPPYNRFIEWQFKKLKEKDLITRGSHPVGWCPSCESPMGQHDTEGDVEPDIGEVILVKFRLGDLYLPTGTLRPETLFGVTNLWVRPDLEYVRAQVDGELWIISPECAEKLSSQNHDVRVKGKIKGDYLLGKKAENSLAPGKVVVLPASFVDPGNATGIVMSVPGHAPFDYIALEELKKDASKVLRWGIQPSALEELEPISMIHLPGYSQFPALEAVQKLGVEDQSDIKAEEATKEVYSKEFHMGVMKENTGEYNGLPVSEARERVERDLLRRGEATRMYELLNGPVYCRCGGRIAVKILEDQWFINYIDGGWKGLTHRCLEGMRIIPQSLVLEFENVIDWLREKACARKHGLGTRLPWDQEWIIESLSDSVIYMSYYTISRTIKERNLSLRDLSPEVFDYVLLGNGDPHALESKTGLDKEVMEEMREEFTYFYPLDSRHSGRDLVPNHLTFFIYNHAAIFPKELWPRQIVVNGSVLMQGKKMSKSFGNIIPLREALQKYGADPLRVAVVATAELLQDADFRPTLVNSIKDRLERYYASALKLMAEDVDKEVEKFSTMDRWMISRLQLHIKTVTEAMEELRFRPAVQNTLYLIDQDIQWYLRRSPKEEWVRRGVTQVLRQVLEARTLLLAPFAPHLCEEIWHKMGKTGLISTAEWPEYDTSKIEPSILRSEELVKSTQEDISNILQATKIESKRIFLYASSEWKWRVYMEALEMAEDNSFSRASLMKKLMKDASLRKKAKRVSAFVSKITSEIRKMPPEILEKRRKTGKIDEFQALKNAEKYYARELKAEIKVFREEGEGVHDPKKRARLAEPYRPAIYIE